jgi:hypothetical protein
MLTSLFRYESRPIRYVNVLTPYLRHLHMGTLALILLVGLAVVTNLRGKLLEVRSSAPSNVSDREAVSCASKQQSQ